MIRRLIGFILITIAFTLASVIGFVTITSKMPNMFFMIGLASLFTGYFIFVLIFDDSMFRFVEFDEVGITFYRKENIKNQIQYIYSILSNADKKVVYHVKYDDIEKLIIRCTKRYQKLS